MSKPQWSFRGTHLFPQTNVIRRLLRDFASFQSQQYTQLEDIFDFSTDPPKNNHDNGHIIDLSYARVPAIPAFTVDAFIELSYYSKQPALFQTQKTAEETMEEMKHKTGQDLPRMDRRINGEKDDNLKYNSNMSEVTSFEATDLFYDVLIREFRAQRPNQSVPMNKITQIVLLSRQNVFNLMVDVITKTVSHIVEPELPYIFKVRNETDITILSNQMTMLFRMNASWLITQNQLLDPEYPCGNVNMGVLVDIDRNQLELSFLNIHIDMSKCGPPPTNSVNANEPNNANVPNNEVVDASSSPFTMERVIPAIGATAGVVLTPFLLGAMGGTSRKRYVYPVRRRRHTSKHVYRGRRRPRSPRKQTKRTKRSRHLRTRTSKRIGRRR